jgi:hypothetical protein
MTTRRLFTADYTGLANRLEGLSLSFAIKEAYGHEICLDWPELDALEIKDTTKRRMWPWHRIGAIRLNDCDEAQFASLGRYRSILQRSVYSPASLPKRHYLETAAKIRLSREYAGLLREIVAKASGRPVVGVHIRGGDFKTYDERVYDIERARHQAVPMWWYESLLRRYRAQYPDVVFLLSHSGDPARFEAWRKAFDTIETSAHVAHTGAREQHMSAGHPALDLFALASCSVMIATPNSSFSHFAANALGPATSVILPPARTTAEAPEAGVLNIHGERLPLFVSAATKPELFKIIRGDTGLPTPAALDTGWI